jgi:hypothetical protein
LVQQMMYHYHWPLFQLKLLCSHPWPTITRYRYKYITFVGFEILTAMLLRIQVLWDAVPDFQDHHSAFIFKGWALQSLYISWTTHPTTQHHNSRQLQSSYINSLSGIFQRRYATMVSNLFSLTENTIIRHKQYTGYKCAFIASVCV